MNQKQFQTFLLTRVLVRNEFGSINALIKAIEEAQTIPAESHWRARKAAFNAIAEKGPMRTDLDYYCFTHQDIPVFLETEWNELNTFQSMTRGRKGEEYDEALARFWQVATPSPQSVRNPGSST